MSRQWGYNDKTMQEDNDNFDWIIGANTLGDDSLRAIAELKQADKEDIKAIKARRGGDTETLAEFLKALYNDGLV